MMTTTFSPAQPPQTTTPSTPSSAPCATAYRNRAAYCSTTYELSHNPDSKSSTPQKNCSSPPNNQGQPDSDCSSSGLGGMTNPNCCSNSSNSSSLDSDSRDSGGGRSPSQHKSLTATATLTPASLAAGMQQHGIPPLMQPSPMVPMSQLPPHMTLGMPPPVYGPPASKHWVGPPPPPPPMQRQPPLYTMTAATCEGAALAAAAAAAAGYHVSFGLDCWPATNGGAQPPSSTVLAGQSSNSAGPNASSTSNSNSNTAGTTGVSPPPASNSQSSGIGGSSVTTSLPAGLPAGIAAAINGGHDLFVHIHPGDAISLAVGNEIQHIAGPATIRMVSQSSTPPSAIPMSVPQGHVVQQLLDRQGLLSHIIMSNEGPSPVSNIGLGSPALASTSSRVSTTGSLQGLASKTGNSLRSGATTPSHKFVGTAQQANGSQQQKPTKSRNNGNSPKSVSPGVQPSLEMGDQTMYQGGINNTPQRNWCSPPNIVHPSSLNTQANSMAGAFVSPNNGLLNTGYIATAKRDGPPGPASALMYPVIDAATMGGPAGMAVAYNALMVANENELNHYGIEEDERERLRETLNSLLPPSVGRVGARDADIVWLELDTSEAAASGGPFPQIDASEFSYEIFVYEGNPMQAPRFVMQHRCSANGASGSSATAGNSPSSPSPSASNGFCCLTRLKPATDYMVNIRASLPERELVGNLSPHTSFRTLPCKPDTPQMPKCVNRQTTMATVAWRMPPANGFHINAYLLQISKGKSGSEPFETSYEGLNEQFRLTNLEPGACYRVRVIARNDLGASEPSAPLIIYMQHHSPASTPNYAAASQQQHHHNPHRQQPPALGLQKPAPPTVLSVSARSVRLSWNVNILLNDFISVILEMCDFTRTTPNIYNPIPNECYSNTFANINGLQSNREYRFRLAATSSHGEIIRSDYVSVKTHKDRYENPAYYSNSQNYQTQHPQQQYVAQQEIRVPTPTQLQRLYDDEEVVEIGWKYNGRDYENVSYVVEAASLGVEEGVNARQDWMVCYKGSSTSASIQDSNLCLFRVQSVNNKRQASSSWSDTLMVKRLTQRTQKTSSKQSAKGQQAHQQSTPVPAVKLVCSAPKFSQIKAHSAKITWKQVPDPTINKKEQQANELSDVTVASSPVNSLIYELQRVDKQPMIIYSGNEFEYELKNLRPMEHIQVRLRAILLDAEGKRQEGDWSAVGFACSLCDVASSPLNLQIQAETSDSPTTSTPTKKNLSVTLVWDAPSQINGSSIQEYIVKAVRKAPNQGSKASKEEKLGTSSETTFTINKLVPAQHYVFYVCAVNEAGTSNKSNEVEYESPASVPDAPDHVIAEAVSTSEIRLTWNQPNSNGSPVSSYLVTVYRIVLVEGQKSQKIEVEELTVGADEEESLLVNGLETETCYEFTIEAENSIGKSTKERVRCTTQCPPPEPPLLSLVQAAANSLKLKWTPSASTSAAAYYYMEKENENGTFSPVYEGELRTAKVKGLKERSVHRFRIRAAISRGVMMGSWSSMLAFNTIRQPPNGVKTAPVVTELSTGIFQVEWPAVRSAVGTEDEINGRSQLVYRLQTSPKLGRDKTGALEPWKTVYEGPSTMCTLPLAGAASTKQARVLVVQKFYTTTCTDNSEGAEENVEESVSAPSPISLLSTIRTPTDLSPKKRTKPNGSAGQTAVNGPRGALGRQISSSSSTTGPHHKVSLYKKLKRFAAWLKKTVSEKDCALIVLAIFVFLAVGIAVFLNSYYEF